MLQYELREDLDVALQPLRRLDPNELVAESRIPDFAYSSFRRWIVGSTVIDGPGHERLYFGYTIVRFVRWLSYSEDVDAQLARFVILMAT